VLLNDARGGSWYAEPHVHLTIPERIPHGGSDDAMISERTVVGTFRHDDCSWVSNDGERFPDFTCRSCATIPNENDFRFRLVRRREGTHRKSRSRLDQMPTPRLLEAAQALSAKNRAERQRLYYICARLVATNARVRKWRDRALEGAKRGELKKMVDELTTAYEAGKFKEKRALWNFLKDIVHQTHLTDEEGKRSHGMRYSESTSRIYAVLRKIGGPRTQRFIYDNLGGPE
jgi:hypothetical protein